MKTITHTAWLLGAAVIALSVASGERAYTQNNDANSAPNPYKLEDSWVQLSADRKMGSPIGVEVDKDGKSLWVFDRCGGDGMACAKSKVAPIMHFDPAGKMIASFGAETFNFPHGLGVDKEGNVYATDGRAKNLKGGVVVKYSPQGRALMVLGRPGIPGDTNDLLSEPADVAIAATGDIYVADGHGGQSNDRIVKYNKDGKFIKAWAKHGKAPGELDTPHGIAVDAAGNVYVADRVNSRVQVFDGDGKLLHEWKQFGRPSSVFVDKNNVLYVADSQSNERTNPGFKQGIRIGDAKEGKVTAYIPEIQGFGAPESISVDDAGTVYAGFTNKMELRRFVKK
jgi:DNA-binding beta-propeller fold protein YncE